MKAIFARAVLWIGAGVVLGQTAVGAGSGGASKPQREVLLEKTVTQRGGDFAVVEWDEEAVQPDGSIAYHRHSYVELATGLHYLEEGQWKATEETVEILPNGEAGATKGPHKVYFDPNINTYQAIRMDLPDGERLASHVLGLAYYDTASGQYVLIAELQDSTGQILPTGNQVLYPDAFKGVKASLRYTYTKAGFEQDVVLEEQPPSPTEWGLNPETTRLQVWTEFVDPPALRKQKESTEVENDTLNFGSVQMVKGRAFELGQETEGKVSGVPVAKRWEEIEGRSILMEEVELPAVWERLLELPEPAEPYAAKPVETKKQQAAARPKLPAVKMASVGGRKMETASVDYRNRKGFVVDYATITAGNSTNFTVAGNTTYYVSGALYLYGTNTFEGGTVIKYAANASISMASSPTPTIRWDAGPYRPVIMTAKDDNSVGETISGSTGSPSGYYANPALALNQANLSDISHAHVRHAASAFYRLGSAVTFRNLQVVSSRSGVVSDYNSTYLRNALFYNVVTNLVVPNNAAAVFAENVTFVQSTNLLHVKSGNTAVLRMTNCVLSSILSLYPNAPSAIHASHNGFYNCTTFGSTTYSASTNQLQSVGAGSGYLVAGSPFKNVGTTNVDSTLLAGLKKRTTTAPTMLSNVVITTPLTLLPIVQRDVDAPDLGYHYDPIDYITRLLTVTNTTLSISNGTVIGCYNDNGIWIQDRASIVSVGTPQNPNRFTRYQAVQEQPVFLGSYTPSSAFAVNPYHYGTNVGSALYRFTESYVPASGGWQFYQSYNFGHNGTTVRDCTFYGGQFQFTDQNIAGHTVDYANNLFIRTVVDLQGGNYTLNFHNNLTRNATVVISAWDVNVFTVKDNAFEGGEVEDWLGSTFVHSHNAYITTNIAVTGRFFPTNASDVVLSSFIYTNGAFGGYYHFSTGLTNKGSRASSAAGLYHHTVLASNVKETTSTVDIGFHYIAANASGQPLDTDEDGWPDYFEDKDGDGNVYTGETDWISADDPGFRIWITKPKNTSTLP